MSDALLLAKVLFPDAVSYHYVRTPEVIEAYPPEITTASYMNDNVPPDKLVEPEYYKLRLEPIADGVWAGMSVWSRIAYIYDRARDVEK
jgi:hypothetical protein